MAAAIRRDELRHVDRAEVVSEVPDLVQPARAQFGLGARRHGVAVRVVDERDRVAQGGGVAVMFGRHLIGDERDRRPAQDLAGRAGRGT